MTAALEGVHTHQHALAANSSCCAFIRVGGASHAFEGFCTAALHSGRDSRDVRQGSKAAGWCCCTNPRLCELTKGLKAYNHASSNAQACSTAACRAISTMVQQYRQYCARRQCACQYCACHHGAGSTVPCSQLKHSAETGMHQAGCSASQNVNAVVPSDWTKTVAEHKRKTHQHLRFPGDHSAEY